MKRKPGRPRSSEGPRKAAWRILLEWEERGDALEAVREKHFRGHAEETRDRALITELTQGTVRHMAFLDHTILSSLDRPERSLPGPVLAALRLGAYQLIHLHRIPAHAAVMETVQVVKESRYRRFSPLVNAVLRKIADRGPSPIPPFDKDPVAHMELATSMPPWLVKRLVSSRGTRETLRILQALNHTPPLTLRVNTARTTREELLTALLEQGISARPGKISPTAVVLEDRAAPLAIEPFRAGLCSVQDEGAQMIAPLLELRPGHRILDACAAPGGKSAHLSELIPDGGFVVAADISLRRARMMTENLQRIGAGNVRIVTADLRTASSPLAEGVFDGVLLDAPCSGTGVLRRHPEGKWRKDPATISGMTAVQGDLLAAAAHTLKKGGELLYTTCSILEEENEEVVKRFLSTAPQMARVDMRGRFPGWRPDLFSETGDLRLWPHLHDCDGFYACLMVKK